MTRDLAFLDFSKAFDCVPHKCLLPSLTIMESKENTGLDKIEPKKSQWRELYHSQNMSRTESPREVLWDQ